MVGAGNCSPAIDKPNWSTLPLPLPLLLLIYLFLLPYYPSAQRTGIGPRKRGKVVSGKSVGEPELEQLSLR